MIIADEKDDSLHAGILNVTSSLRRPNCIIRADNAAGFLLLVNDALLLSSNIKIDLGNPKYKNKNPVVDKGIQELDSEILRHEHGNTTLTLHDLQMITTQLNGGIRKQGLSSKSIIFSRDQQTGELLNIDNHMLMEEQKINKTRNPQHSTKPKACGRSAAKPANVAVGDLLHIKQGDKFKARKSPYVVTQIETNYATSKSYTVPLNTIFPATPTSINSKCSNIPPNNVDEESSSDSDVSNDDARQAAEHIHPGEELDEQDNGNTEDPNATDDEGEEEVDAATRYPVTRITRPWRRTRSLTYLNDYILQ